MNKLEIIGTLKTEQDRISNLTAEVNLLKEVEKETVENTTNYLDQAMTALFDAEETLSALED